MKSTNWWEGGVSCVEKGLAVQALGSGWIQILGVSLISCANVISLHTLSLDFLKIRIIISIPTSQECHDDLMG